MTETPIVPDLRAEDHARPLVAVLLLRALRLCGRVPCAHLQALGALAGRLAFLAGSRGAATARANIGWCFPDLDAAQRRALAKAAMAANGRLAAEFVWLAAHPRVDSLVAEVHGGHLIEDLGGRGCLALIPHFGNWELLHAWVASRQPLHVMYRPQGRRWLDALLREIRAARASRLLPASRGGVRAALTALRQAAVVAMLPDQVPQRGGTMVRFFGCPARTMTLAARLAMRTGVPVAIAWAERRPDGRFAVHIERLEARRSSVQAFMSDVNAAIEAVVRRAPEQYQWTYKRFKRQGPGRFRYYR